MAVNRLLTDRVIHRLEALAEAIRQYRVRVPFFQPGGFVQRPAPVHFNAPYRLERMGDPAPDPEIVEGHTFGHPVIEPAARRTCTCGRGPFCACGFCVDCRGYDQAEAIRTSYGYPTRRRDVFGPRATPAELGGAWVPGQALSSCWPAGQRPHSYTGGEDGALEEIRQAGERLNEGLAGGYRPIEGATSSCSACPALVAPEDLWVGKRSGIALCDPCMVKWEKAGRAKRTGEF